MPYLKQGDKLVIYGLVYIIVIWGLCLLTMIVKRSPVPIAGEKKLDEILYCVKGAK